MCSYLYQETTLQHDDGLSVAAWLERIAKHQIWQLSNKTSSCHIWKTYIALGPQPPPKREGEDLETGG